MRRERMLFSGRRSRMLWRDIDRLFDSNEAAWEALYTMGCLCQALESRVERLREELAKVKRGKIRARRAKP